MTDIEIMIALECHDGDVERCLRCPYRTSDDCHVKLSNDALDLIKRQKAEIERLEAMVDAAEEHFSPLPFRNNFDKYISKSKADAYKEFAERLKERKYQSSDWSHGEHPYVVEEDDINDILQELTEGESGESQM